MYRQLVAAPLVAQLLAAPITAQTWVSDVTIPLDAPAVYERARLGAFGAAAVLVGDELFVGSPEEVGFFPVPPNGTGAVHVLGLDPATGLWAVRARVSAADVEIGDGFGQALAVSGDRLVVGAPKRNGMGAAYVFERDASGGWRQVARLSPAGADGGDEVGASVAIDGDRVLVGAPGRAQGRGAVAAYERRADGWTFVGLVEGEGASAGDRFGTSISLDGLRALVGAPGSLPGMLPGGPPPDIRAGSAHVLEMSGGTWMEAARLAGSAPSGFGWASVLAGDEMYVSAPFANGGVGAVHRYVRDAAGSWSAAQEVTAAGAPAQQVLGLSLARAGTDVVAGAPLAGGGVGAAFVFGPGADGTWGETQVLPGRVPFGFFGMAVAGSDGTVLVGSPGSDFFEGIVHRYQRDDAGSWTEADPIVPEVEPTVAVVGGTVECTDGTSSGFGCDGVDLVSYLPVSELGGGRGIIVNDVWGWTDPVTGHEIAIVGRNDGTAFLDLSDPESPVYLGDLPLSEGATVNLWRDMKVYADHVFVVADAAGAHGVQIFDLTQLRDHTGEPRHFEETARYDGIFSAHNIVINEETGFAYVVGASGGGETCGGGLHAVDVRDPRNPTFAGCFADPATGLASSGYSHDAQCVVYHGPDEAYQGHELCFGANETALSIQDVTDKDAPVAVAAATYPNSAYLHQGWISDDHRYFYMNDELDELTGAAERTRTLIWDIQELDDPILVKQHMGSTAASDHNLYVHGDFMYQSNYVAGLQVLDISDPENPVEVGSFDTVTAGSNAPGFAGSWSNYPYFESGIVIVTSMREGLFVVRKRPPPVS